MQMISKEKRQIFMCISLVIVLLVCSFSDFVFKSGEVYAYTEKTGTVTASSLNVRSGPGTTYKILGTVHKNDVVRIVGEANASDGKVWYQINYNDGKGYVSSSYITNIRDVVEYTPDADFEAYLNAQGFPESYKDGLRRLHTQYPNWIFVADHLAYDWNTAWTNQSKVGRSLISKNAISSHKSLAKGSYNWDTGAWYTFDGGSWCAASEELVAYYMDPRNFFNEDYIWMFEQLAFDPTIHNINDLEKILTGTFMAKDANVVKNDETGEKVTYAEILMIAAEKSGVSPYYLASSILIEMGNKGGSDSISGTLAGHEGYYNYYNWKAYAANGNSPIVNGLIYAAGTDEKYMRPWNTRYKAIIGGAKMFADGYISIGQDTLYYKKFDYVGTPYTHQYMTHIKAHATEALKTSKAYSKELKEKMPMVFRIPVFKNMPTDLCPYPTGDGSPNNVLSSLTVAGQSLTPTFSKFTTEYSLVVEHDVTSINVSATAIASTAKVTGTGAHNLKEGSNIIPIVVTAQNGATRTYNIEIVRLGPDIGGDSGGSTDTPGEGNQGGEGGEGNQGGEGGEVTPEKPVEEPLKAHTSLTMDIDSSSITGITPGSSIEEILSTFTVSGGTVSVLDSNGQNKVDGKVATGDKVVIKNTNGTETYTYNVIIYGDVNGDGAVNIKDLIVIQKNILNMNPVGGIFASAADTNRDGSCANIKDLIMVQKVILGMGDIEQK